MANFNQVILMGNLTRDPKLSYLPSKVAVVDFGLAVNRKWKAENGSDREEVCFTECQMFGKPAEVIAKYLKKGSSLFVRGHLKFEQWEKDGRKHSRTRVIVERFEFLGKDRD